MADIRNHSALIVAKNCDRTANVQISDPDTPATYIGTGETVITDTAGTVLNTTTAVKAISEIQFHTRSENGNFRPTLSVKGEDIVGYTHQQFLAPQGQVTVVDFTEFGLTNHTYILKFTSYKDFSPQPFRQTIEVEVGGTALTKAQLAQAFADKINLFFNEQNIDYSSFRLTAAVQGTSSDQLVISTFIGREPDGLNYHVNYQRFYTQAIGYEATIVDNLTAAINTNGVTVNQAQVGKGDYWHVRECEKTERGFTESLAGRVAYNTYAVNIPYETELLSKYEADGTTLKRYDMINIHWRRGKKSFSGDHTHQGVIKLFLPVEDNGTNQVDGANTSSIVKVLNKYIVTEYGVGTAFTVS